MFDKLFKQPCALSRQLKGPLASERASFLAQRAEEGAARDTLVRLARELLVVVRELDLTSSYLITLAAVETVAGRWARQQRRRRRARTLQWPRVFFCRLPPPGFGTWAGCAPPNLHRSPLPRW